MKMFEKDGSLILAWKAGSGVMIHGRGHTADTLLALASGIKEVIERTVPPESRLDCAKNLTELLMEMMQMPVTKIDIGAMKDGANDD